MGCNAINANNTANFLSFLQELRADPVGAKLTLSTATPVTPFHDASGNPSADLGDFARVLDYVAIMDYDVWDSSSPYIRPNAPLDDACAPPAYITGIVLQSPLWQPGRAWGSLLWSLLHHLSFRWIYP